jgi:hypothetical protein
VEERWHLGCLRWRGGGSTALSGGQGQVIIHGVVQGHQEVLGEEDTKKSSERRMSRSPRRGGHQEVLGGEDDKKSSESRTSRSPRRGGRQEVLGEEDVKKSSDRRTSRSPRRGGCQEVLGEEDVKKSSERRTPRSPRRGGCKEVLVEEDVKKSSEGRTSVDVTSLQCRTNETSPVTKRLRHKTSHGYFCIVLDKLYRY